MSKSSDGTAWNRKCIRSTRFLYRKWLRSCDIGNACCPSGCCLHRSNCARISFFRSEDWNKVAYIQAGNIRVPYLHKSIIRLTRLPLCEVSGPTGRSSSCPWSPSSRTYLRPAKPPVSSSTSPSSLASRQWMLPYTSAMSESSPPSVRQSSSPTSSGTAAFCLVVRFYGRCDGVNS